MDLTSPLREASSATASESVVGHAYSKGGSFMIRKTTSKRKLDPADIDGSAAYERHLTGLLFSRAVARVFS